MNNVAPESNTPMSNPDDPTEKMVPIEDVKAIIEEHTEGIDDMLKFLTTELTDPELGDVEPFRSIAANHNSLIGVFQKQELSLMLAICLDRLARQAIPVGD